MDTLLIGIEGSDGVGKATQSALLKEWFQSQGSTVAVVSFPRYNETEAGKDLWKFLKGPDAHTYEFSKLDPYKASEYYAHDRRDSLPYLKRLILAHRVVMFDRYVESNLIHQGGKLPRGALDEFGQWINNLEYKKHKLPRPHIIFYLDLPLEVALRRTEQRAKEQGLSIDAVEADTEYIKNSHYAGIYYAERLGWTIIPCVLPNGEELSESEVHGRIRGIMERRYNLQLD